jgi:DNA-binding NarL/FixJ family response regulator
MKTSPKIRVVLIDDQEVARMGVRTALANETQIEIVAEGTTESDALRLTEKHHPDVLLLGLNKLTSDRDCRMALSACQTIEGLMKTCATKILVLCGAAQQAVARAVLRAGAKGFMLKDEVLNSCAVLVQAILDVARKKNVLLSPVLHERLSRQGFVVEDMPQLTYRRIEIMQTLADNPQLTLPEIAVLLNMAESTLRNNLNQIADTLDTPHIAGAMAACLRLGVVQV